MIDYEFYPTPDPFTHWLFDEVPIRGRVLEPCVGDGAIVRAAGANQPGFEPCREWFTNDLDPRWSSDSQLNAATPALRHALAALGQPIDWSVSNPPFTPAVEIIEEQLNIARVGVAMHLRASIHEVLKTGVRRTWLSQRPPTGILWLPRFAYQRSKTKGEVVDRFGDGVLGDLAQGSCRAAIHQVRARMGARRAEGVHPGLPAPDGHADARNRPDRLRRIAAEGRVIEPAIGARVRFKESGSSRVGVVTDVITAGRENGRGVWALRRRARTN
jgi:hypothetical protein